MSVFSYQGVSVLYAGTMHFGWINVFGAAIDLLLLLPLTVFEIKFKDRSRRHLPVVVSIFEKILWVICCILMVVNVGLPEFGFCQKSFFVAYLIGNVVLLLAYYILWFFFFLRPLFCLRVITAVVAMLTFLVSGATLVNILLIVFTGFFGICHVYVAAQDKYD